MRKNTNLLQTVQEEKTARLGGYRVGPETCTAREC